MKFLKENFTKLLTACVLLVIGILCIVADCANSESSLDAFEGISVTIGVVLMVISGIAIILSLVASIIDKNSLLLAVISSAVMFGTGLFFTINKLVAGTLILNFINLIPYILLALGSLVCLDALLKLIFSIIKKDVKASLVAVIVEFVIAGITILLGALTIGSDPVIDKQLLIFGIIVILFAIVTVVNCFNKGNTIVIVKKEEK